ncbi:MAG: DUF6503 family protein [Planctomycetota bacterium]|jgi:hypothetical protein
MHRSRLITTIFTSVMLAAIATAAPVAPAAPAAGQDATFQSLLEAHGGLDAWQQARTLRFGLRDFPLGAKAPLNDEHIVDLQARRIVVTGDDYALASNGDEAWITPDPDAAGLPARFYAEGSFYFIGMPFVFADPGVVVTAAGTRTLDGREYDALSVRYENGVGNSDEDDYILYVDRDTHRLHLINFRPTDTRIRGEASIDELPRKVLVFDEWQASRGVLLPKKATFYGWENDQLVGDGNSFTVAGLSLDRAATDASTFAAPEGAVIVEPATK